MIYSFYVLLDCLHHGVFKIWTFAKTNVKWRKKKLIKIQIQDILEILKEKEGREKIFLNVMFIQIFREGEKREGRRWKFL